MDKTAYEKAADFLLEFLPDLLPTPMDSTAKAAVSTFKDQLDGLLAQPRIKKELLEAARQAEQNFRSEAPKQLNKSKLVEAVASFPLYDRDFFQKTLQSLPDHLNEDFLAKDLTGFISDDWKGEFSPDELREGMAIYLNCLRVQLLKVDGYADLVTRLATLRTDARTESILAIVKELLALVKSLLNKTQTPLSVATTLFTITAPVTDFTGREKELERLKTEISHGALISGVSGGGGIGKTELARKLALDIANDFPDARMEINLLGISETPLSSEEAMRRLIEPFYPNQKLPDDPNQLKGLYQQTFANQKALLLLDNAANASQVRPLIPSAPSVAIITSRQHFSLIEFGWKEPLRLDVLSPEKSRELLRSASGKLKDATNLKVDELATLCGRLPLALRVAASLLNDRPDWALDTLLKRLDDEHTRLKRLKRDDDQDLNVEAAIGLSYSLLSPELQRQLRALSTFTSPFWRFSAAVVWGMDEEESADDSLGVFVNRSLLTTFLSPFRKEEHGEYLSFYYLHDFIRLYAVERLLEYPKEADEAISRHAEHYLQFAQLADRTYQRGGKQATQGIMLFRFIWPQLKVAWDRLRPEQKYWPQPPTTIQWLSNFPAICAKIFDSQIPRSQQIDFLIISLNAAQQTNNMRAELHYQMMLGGVYDYLGDKQNAMKFTSQALTITRKIPDRSFEANCLINLGDTYSSMNRIQDAIDSINQAIAITHEINDRIGEGHGFLFLGKIYAGMNEFSKAIDFYQQAATLFHEVEGGRHPESNALLGGAKVYAAVGDYLTAVEFSTRALVIYQEFGDDEGIGNTMIELALSHVKLGRMENATACAEQAVKVFEIAGSRNLALARQLLEQINKDKSESLGEWISLEDLTRRTIAAFRNKSTDVNMYFDLTSKFISDPKSTKDWQELGKVLQRVLVGIKNPDLSGLPDELAKLVKDELNK